MRHWFGQSPSDWTFTTGTGTGGAVLLAGGVTLTLWNQPSGGTQYTDLLDASGQPITQVVTSDGSTLPTGTIPQFQGPDEVLVLWADAGTGVRYVLVTTDLADQITQALVDVAAAQAAAQAAAADAQELAESSSIAGHVAQADPHAQYIDDERGDARYFLQSWGTVPPLTAPLSTLTFASTPASSDSDMWQVYVTNSGVTRLVTWWNERGYYRAEQVPGALYDSPSTLIGNYQGTGPVLNIQQRNAANARVNVGGIDINGRTITSLQAWTDITALDPGATGRYTEDTTTGTAPLQVRNDTDDIIRFQGRVAVNSSGTTSGQTVFNLPAGFAPDTNRLLPVPTTTGIACPCEVMTSGAVVLRRTQTGALSLAFDDLTFAR